MGVFVPLPPLLPPPLVGVGTVTGADETVTGDEGMVTGVDGTVTGTDETGFLADEVLVDVGVVDDFEEPFPELELELLLPPLLLSESLFLETTIPIIAPMRIRMTMDPIQMTIFRRPLLLVGLVTDDAWSIFSLTVSTSAGSGYE